MAPGPRLQSINAALHKEPLYSITYCIFWFFILCVVAPLAGTLVLVPLGVYRVLSHKFDWDGVHDFDPAKQDGTSNKKIMSIVVTGCDSGFGKELSLWAAKAGYVVFAGCLRKESFDQFEVAEAKSRIIPFVLDVTKDEDVEKSSKLVSGWIEAAKPGEIRVLHALVNNAGISIAGFFDWLEIPHYQKVMDVNYFGVLRCCKAFLPILKQQFLSKKHVGSRIINITSMAGCAPGGPVSSTYAASKHAAQAFTDSLRKEVACFGIGVTAICPTFHETNIVKGVTTHSDLNKTWDQMPSSLREEYGVEFKDQIANFGAKFCSATCWKPQVVVDEILKVLMVRDAPGQVFVGTDSKYFYTFMIMLPAWITSSTKAEGKMTPSVLKIRK